MAVERTFKMFGHTQVDVLVSSAASDGSMSVLVEHCGPGEGPPAHVHSREDEFIKPIEGAFEMLVGGEWATMPPEGVFFPRQSGFHTFRCSGPIPGKVLIVAAPGGLDEFLEKHADLKLPGDDAAVMALAAEYGIAYADDDR